MCGINFVVDVNPKFDKAKAMLCSISHRGKERSGSILLNDSRYQLAHTRLPIQGLGHEFNQPYFYKDYVIGFVGEIFNYKEFNSRAKSDVLVLAEMWDKMGIEAFKYFDGFWSVVIIDRQTQCAHIITDSLAKKPLYYRAEPGQLLISSEIFPLAKKGDELDEFYFSSVAKWGYALNDRTPFNKIKKLPPFCYMTISIDKGEIDSDYEIYDTIKPQKHDLRQVIEQAVINRLVSDVPVSLLLSGGLDSTIIFELIKKHTHNFTVFHVENQEADFLNYLKIPTAVKMKQIKLEEVSYGNALMANQTPVDLGSVRPQFALAKAIRKEGFDVAISGDGADELFGGYTRISTYDSQYSDVFEELVYYHLPRLDRIMMNQTIELRCPFLSRPVVEVALSLPYEMRMHKRILKDTFFDLVPKEIIFRMKHALKIQEIREDPMKARLNAIKIFRELMEAEYECERRRISCSGKG